MTWTSAYAALAGAIALEVTGSSLLQRTEQFTRPLPTGAALACYGAAFYLLSVTLRTVPLGIAYAIWAGVGIVLTAIIGLLVFRQGLDAPALLGIGLIVAGVLVLQLCSGAAGHGA